MSNHGLPDYTVSDLLNEHVYPALRATGKQPRHLCLEWQKYIPLVDDAFSSRRYTPIPAVNSAITPNITSVNITTGNGDIRVIARNGAEILTQDGLLEVWAATQPPGQVGGYLRLELGIYTYPTRQPMSSLSGVARQLFGAAIQNGWGAPGWTQPAANLVPPVDSHVPTAVQSTEPPCHCSSRALATVGHDAGCQYIKWRGNNK